jgi:hypothetical protein
MLSLILLIAGFICCVIAAFWYPSPNPRPHMGWLGVSLYLLSLILEGALHLAR